MQKLKKITEHPVIASLIAAAIIAIFTYFVTMEKLKLWVATVFEYIGIGFSYIFKGILFVLTFEVAIWHILVFFILLIGGLFLYAKWEEKQNNIEEVSGTNNNGMQTTDNENLVLKAFERNYGESLSVENIARLIGTSDMLLVEHTIDGLVNSKGFLTTHYNIMYETTYSLTRSGRDYILRYLRE